MGYYNFQQYHFAPHFPNQGTVRRQPAPLLEGELELVDYVWGDDDAGFATNTLDTPTTARTGDDHEVHILRVAVKNNGGVNQPPTAFELWDSQELAAYAEMLDTNLNVRYWASPNWAHDAAVTSSRIAGVGGTFGNGRAAENDSGITGVPIPAGNYTELVFAVMVKRDGGLQDDTFDFRVRKPGGKLLKTYTQTPRLNLNKAPAELGHIENIQSTAVGAASNRTVAIATLAADVSNNVVGQDFEMRAHVLFPNWQPETGEISHFFYDYWDTSSNRALQVNVTEFVGPNDYNVSVSESGTAQDANITPDGGGTDGQELQGRVTFDGDNGSTQSEGSTWKRTASINPATLDNGGSWGTIIATNTSTLITDIHEPSGGISITLWGNRFGQAGTYFGSKMWRLILYEGFAASNVKVVDCKYYDRAYRTPASKGQYGSPNDANWVNQGRAVGEIAIGGTEGVDFDWISDVVVTPFPPVPRRAEHFVHTRF